MLNSSFLSLSEHTFSHTPHHFPTRSASQNPNLHPKFQSLAFGNRGGSEFPSGSCSNTPRRKGVLVVRSKSTLGVEEVVVKGGGVKGKGEEFDAIVIGSGIGGLVAGTQLAVKGARVLVLEKYVIPGGSSGFYQRDGYTFDVGSSVMFGFSDKGNLNLITQALEAVGCRMQVVPDPTTVHFHLPNNLSVRVHKEYDKFIEELTSYFPHEKEGILKFYGECWKIFNALNSLELKSLEEPLYLFGQFFRRPLECLTLAYYLPQNAGAIARKYIQDPQLLSFIDAEPTKFRSGNGCCSPVNKARPKAEGGGSSLMLVGDVSRIVYLNFSCRKRALHGVAVVVVDAERQEGSALVAKYAQQWACTDVFVQGTLVNIVAEANSEGGLVDAMKHIEIEHELHVLERRHMWACAEELWVATLAQRSLVDGDSSHSRSSKKGMGSGGQTVDTGVAGTVPPKKKRGVWRHLQQQLLEQSSVEVIGGRTTSRECFIVSTVNALQTPMINAAMVLCDRHFGGINYPLGGVGGIAKSLAKGLVDQGSEIVYKANVTSIIIEQGKAVGVRLSNGREFFAKTIISNATRWDTFGKLLKGVPLPKEEENFQKVYVKAPSFLSIHMGVKAEVLPPDTDCHHFVLESNWSKLEEPYGSIFLSIPTVLDSSLAPEGRHILHIFTTSSMEDWEGLSRVEYEAKKQLVADEITSRLENKLFPGLRSSIDFMEVGTPKTHRRYLARDEGTYGPMPRRIPKGLLGMPFNTTGIDGLYCVGDSCFPGQGVIAVAFSGVMCAHRVAADIGLEKKSPVLDSMLLRLLGWLRTMA
ncbi:hypothetical protein JHK85_004879 [Glycine max]|nr:hypothetical protein JHK85_004879 [Glycine max]